LGNIIPTEPHQVAVVGRPLDRPGDARTAEEREPSMKNTALNFLRRANGFAWRLTSATVRSVLVRWGRRALPFATRCVWLHPVLAYLR